MAAPMNADQLKEKAAKLRQKLAAKGATMDPAAKRTLAKKVRRAQRRRRVLVARAAKLAAKKADKPAA